MLVIVISVTVLSISEMGLKNKVLIGEWVGGVSSVQFISIFFKFAKHLVPCVGVCHVVAIECMHTCLGYDGLQFIHDYSVSDRK